MEDFWGLLFYIAIIVLGGLAGAYRNKKKRKMMVPPLTKSQEEPEIDEAPLPGFDPFEEFNERIEFKTEEQPEEEKAESKHEPEITFQTDVVSLETMVKTPEEEGIAAFEETREIIQSDSLQDEDMIAEGQISDQEIKDEIYQNTDLDLPANIREGIIYSEILKRKHF
ncbi:MAG: hypothetical protein JW723_03010 [Bacteroidales bacterium]|nr:hypothetical protein [Bacteroidales bacterium]